MSVSFARAVADGLRRHGITVHYWDGWDRRGNGQTSDYDGGLQHHTATAFGMAPAILVHGRSDLRGPLCNSAGNADGSVTIIAAHPANHAGASGGKSMGPLPVTRSFNRRVWGHEIVYPGTQPMKPAQYHTALVLSGVIGGILGRRNAEWIRGHGETSITGKWDPGDGNRMIDMGRFRSDIWPALHNAPAQTGAPDVELNTTFTSAWGKPLSYGDYLKFSDQRLVNIERTVAALSNELFGPRGAKGEIKGWGTTNGPRTVVAMLVDLVNAAYQPIPSAVGDSDYAASPRQYLANADAYGYANTQKLNGLLAAFNELADAYADERGTDAEAIKQAVMEALAEGALDVNVNITQPAPESTVADERAELAEPEG